ncbi:uncharacterized protein LOC132321610 [Gavia stellata]|uniref:uncharacterized protein LOC132321610 n=1 Tax=Gavia stellata TaxID=37040 RepID=UPI00289F4AA8|nr:uncharacterized protein LOC132321610 [Gavia stellata]
MFSAAFTRSWFYRTSMGWKVQRWQKMESAQAIRAALMRTYSGIALRAPKEQLLTRVDKEIRERALQVCTHVLGACKERFELMRGRPCKRFGSLVGLLATLTSDCLATSRQRAWVCLGYLLQMQARTMEVVPQADEIRCLGEELNSPDTVQTCAKIAKAVCKCIPPAQATDFLTAVLHSLLHVTPTCVKPLWKWVFIFLVEWHAAAHTVGARHVQ